MFDRIGLEVIDRDTCLRLLASSPVARLALTVGALPVILPVNFVLAGDRIIFRTGDGTKLRSALHHSVVALEVDAVDPMDHSGWSVMVQGTTRVLADADEIAWASTLRLRPWANEEADHYVAISTDVVQGRLLNRVEHEAAVPPLSS